jgi:diadenosine tetraphosphate (Ap4A) HIT family hydrolase
MGVPSISARQGCPLCDRLRTIAEGRDPWLIAELRETRVVLGDNQGCRGWCVLILKSHDEHVAALSPQRRRDLWEDVCDVAAAIRRVFPHSGVASGPPRINYECLGNLVPHIHWHVIPRHADDPEPAKAVWGWPEERLRGTLSDEERRALAGQLREAMGR